MYAANIAKTGEGLRAMGSRLVMILVLLAVSCLPAAAQNGFLAPRAASVAARTFAARLEPPLVNLDSFQRLNSLQPQPKLKPALSFSSRVEAPPRLAPPHYPERPTRLFPRYIRVHSHNSTLESSVDYVETAFAKDVRLPVAFFPGGRLQLAGFYGSHPVGNLLWGPPAAGRQAHPGVWAPPNQESYGLRISIRLKRDSEKSPHTNL